MTFFIDSDCKCYNSGGSGRTPVESSAFDGKCQAFIEGYRFVPAGQTWTRADGAVFSGEMVSPWKDYSWLAAIQAQHELDEAAHSEELGELVDIIYENDLEVIG